MHIAIPKEPGVYRIVNQANGNVYVGSTNNLARRWPEHRKKLRAMVSTCTRLQAAWKKYGEPAFRFEVLEVVADAGRLLVREQYWIDALHPQYNVAPVAGSQAGVRHSPETRALLARLAKPITPEQREKMVAGIRAMSPEAKAACRKKQSVAHMGNTYALGFKQTPETRLKRSLAQKGRVFSDEHREKLKANHWRRRVAA